MYKKSVYVIILNYNHLEDLKETIDSFLLQDYPNLNIIVSDNGSEDQSVEWLKKHQSNLQLIENKENLGYAKGNNVGIRYALKQKADYILIANNDLKFDNPQILSQLMDDALKDPKYILGPQQYFYYHPEKLFASGHYFMNDATKVFNKLRLEYSKTATHPEHLELTDYVPGSFVLFNADLIKDIGYIDEKYFLYGEDADFFLRAWKKGYISLINTQLSILHKVSATSQNGSIVKNYYQSRNIWLNLRKHKDIGLNKGYFRTKAYKGLIKSVVKNLMAFKWQHAYYNMLGFWHGAVIKKYGVKKFN